MIINANGVSIDTYEEILDETQQEWRDEFGNDVSTGVKSAFGQFQRIQALREQQYQEKVLQLYQMLDPRLAEGVHLDQRASLLGVSRLPDTDAEVIGTATCSGSCTINNGIRISVGGNVFQVINGPYSIVGSGTITGIRIQAEDPGELDVSVLGAWTIVDTVANFDSFDDTSQPIAGRLKETEQELRARIEVERFSRASGPLDAIEAVVSKVDGVTYVKAWENVDTDPVDSDGIPYQAINVVVEGGDDTEIATAIRNSGPAGHLFYGSVAVELETGPDKRTVSFDRVSEVDIWVNVDFVTSTSEESTPVDLEQAAKDALMDYAMGPVDPNTGGRKSTEAAWQIGTDVLPVRLVGALASISGHDGITVTTSLDDVSYIGTKRAMTLRQRAVLAEVRITVTES